MLLLNFQVSPNGMGLKLLDSFLSGLDDLLSLEVVLQVLGEDLSVVNEAVDEEMKGRVDQILIDLSQNVMRRILSVKFKF